MASQQRQDEPHRRNDGSSNTSMFLAPPAAAGVQLSDENRLVDEDDVYECPSCGARLVVAEG